MSHSILSDQLWQRIEPLLPKPKQSRHVQHAGRKPADPRRVMTGILFVLKTGMPWKAPPATSDFPSGHTCRRRLLE
jgi:transposase